MYIHHCIVLCVILTVISNGFIFSFRAYIEQLPSSYNHNSHHGVNSIHDFDVNNDILFASSFVYRSCPAILDILASYGCRSGTSLLSNPSQSAISSLFYLSMLLMLQSGDLHPNPGPYKPKYPCNICSKAAKWGQRAICCDDCNMWYHLDCISMSTPSYEMIQDTSVSWICDACGKPNYANPLLFSNTSLELSNSFDCLDDSNPVFSFPLASSSPQLGQNQTDSRFHSSSSLLDRPVNGQNSYSRTSSINSTSNHSNTHDKSKQPTKPKPKPSSNRQSLKFMVINFNGIRGKTSDLSVCIENYCPDIIIASETHLNPSVNSSELFPSNFSVIRKDRDTGHSKGGVLIACRNDLIATSRVDFDAQCEVVWTTVKIKGSKDLTIGSFYRSQQFGGSPEYFNALRDSLNKIRTSSNGQIILGGDFNLPSVNRESMSVDPGGSYIDLSRQMIDIANDFGFEQVVKEPTRGNNILDLFFTSNPTLIERSWVVPGISDHDGIPVIVVSTKPRFIKHKPRKVYQFHKADTSALKSHLQIWTDQFTSATYDNDVSVNTLYDDFTCTIISAMDMFIPSKMITKKNTSPWINKKVKRYQKRKQRAYNTHRKLNTTQSLLISPK